MNEAITTGTLQLPRLIAHRGASHHAPENTLVAMRRAYELGAQWIECDLQLTQDGEVVVFHDDWVNRTTDGQNKLEAMTLAELKQLDCGGWFAETYQNERVPTLPELLSLLKSLHLGANLELKLNHNSTSQLVDKTLKLIGQHWPESSNDLLLSSNAFDCLKILRQKQCPWPIGLISSRWRQHLLKLLHEVQAYSLHLNYKALTAKRVKLIKGEGFKVLSYTVNDASTIQWLWDIGVDSIFTDNITVVEPQ